MCGGIVGAFSIATPARRPFSVPVVTQSGLLSAAADGSLRVLAFNAGRIGSYMIAGALAAGLVGSVATLTQITSLQTMGYWAANLMLIALGASMMQLWHGLAHLESVG